MRVVRWLIAFACVAAAGWALDRLNLPFWAEIILAVLLVTVALTALQAYEAFLAMKKAQRR